MSVPESEVPAQRSSVGRVLSVLRPGKRRAEPLPEQSATGSAAHGLHSTVQDELDAAGRVLAALEITHVATEHAELLGQRDVLAHQLGRAALELRKAKDPATLKVVDGIYTKLLDKAGTLHRSAKDLVGEAASRATALVEQGRDALDKEANRIAGDPLMLAVPKDATTQECKDAGLDATRGAVTSALLTRETRSAEDVEAARKLLPKVQEAITRAEDAARQRIATEEQRARLELLAEGVRGEPLMSAVPVDANAQEIIDAGVTEARAQVSTALGERDTRTAEHIDQARKLLPKVQEAITRAEDAARQRLAREQAERERLAYLAVYTPLVKGADENAALVVSGADSVKKTRLDAGIKTFAADSKDHADALADSKWVAAKDAATRLASSAPALLGAATQYDQDKHAFEQALAAVSDYAAAEKVLKDKTGGALDDEIKDFTDAVKAMQDEQQAGEWAKAKKVIDDTLASAATTLVTTHRDWQAYDKALGLASGAYKTGFYLLQRAPQRVRIDAATEIATLTTAIDEFDDAVDHKQWVAAKAKVEAVAVAAKPVIAAVTAYNGARSRHDTAHAKLKKRIGDAENVFFSASAKVQGWTEFDDFDKALSAWQQASQDDDWAQALLCLPELERTAKDLLDPSLQANFSATDLQDIEDELNAKAGDITTNTAASTNKHIQSLSTAITSRRQALLDALTAGDGQAALRSLGELEDAIGAATDARAGLARYDTDFAAAVATPGGAVTVARALGATPAKLAAARDKQLLASENALKKLADEGRFTLACRRVALWVEEAEGWTDAWNEAKDAQAALAVAPPALPDEGKLNALVAKSGGGKVLDALVLDLGAQPRRDVIAKVMKARFGVDLSLKKYEPVMVNKEVEKEFDVVKTRQVQREVEKEGADGPIKVMETVDEEYTVKEKRKVMELVQDVDDKGKPKFDRKPDSGTDGSKSVGRIYELMCAVPGDYVANCPSLKKITRVGGGGGRSETSFYAGGDKEIVLECGRASAPVGGTRVGNPKEVPDVTDDLYKPVGDTNLSYFNWTTLHEIGHAVDDKVNFMDARGALPDYGGWIEYGADVSSVAEALVADSRFQANGTAYDLDYVKKLLAGKAKSRPPVTEQPAAPTGVDATAWSDARTRLENWVDAVREGQNLWDNGAKTKQLALGGRVYHEAYENVWVSYELAARAKGMSGYQFRAPGEWFAELYAAYYSGKLKPGHPFVGVVEAL